ncbi:MAG: HAD hydrolase-like protein [Acidobacteria bacterium]|nr:HAD hydrolase-like protein [Acidobacteriota bacterium]
MQRRVLIFDLDGTLTDPREGITRCIRAALARAGVPVPDAADLLHYIGPPLSEVFLTILGDETLAAQAVLDFRECYGGAGLYENAPYAGITEAITLLHGHAPALFIATSKPHAFADRILDKLALKPFFRGIYGCEMNGDRADKRELLAHLLERERLAGADAVLIGDRKHDVAAARANGAGSVGVTWGFGSHEELAEAGADTICDTIDELVEWYLADAAVR